MEAMAAKAASTTAAAPEAFYIDPAFWVLVSFVILIALSFKKVSLIVTSMLDERSAAIRKQIDEATQLREDAQDLLASFERKQRDAKGEAEEIVARAVSEAERIAKKAMEDLEHSLKRREQLASDRIAQAEQAAIDEVRNAAVDIALDATRRLLDGNLSKKRADSMVAQAIKELPEKIH
jgi:F-type H+-transporting ATPase subunit b